MKINYLLIATILISLWILPGVVLANSDDNGVHLSDSLEGIFFTPFIFPFDSLSQYDHDALMDYAEPDLWQIPVPNLEYWSVPVAEEEEEIEKSDEYIFQGSITVGPWRPGLDSDILAAFNSQPINIGPVTEGQVYTKSETSGPCGPPEQMRDPGLLEAFRS